VDNLLGGVFMQKGDSYPTADQLREQERRHHAGRMEEEAQLREQYGTPEDREHERVRVQQEWDKIEHDKSKGLSDGDIWGAHLSRMQRMAASMKDPDKCVRRAKHFELAGLSTASRLFADHAEGLHGRKKEPVNAQKDLLIDNLSSFNKFVGYMSDIKKYVPRRVGEIWTREAGQRVTKRPDGVIVPYTPPKRRGSRKADDSQKKGDKNKKSAVTSKDVDALRDAISLEKLSDGTMSSRYFGKTEKALSKLVRELLRKLDESSECLVAKDMSSDEKVNADYRKYNKGVCEAESSAKKFGKRGLTKTGGDSNSASERKFWLSTALVFGELADFFEERRADSLKGAD